MFSPKPLKGHYEDYSPEISPEIMEVHYSKHYCGYINNLNLALKNYPQFYDLQIPEILKKINEMPHEIKEAIQNNGGGAINHEILWETLATKETFIHEGTFKKAICHHFGDWENFLKHLKESCLKLFGSGWVWLVSEENGKLKISSQPNQNSPFMYGHFPIFGIDVWEHAYYLQYKNVRKDYVENILKIIDWEEVEKRYLSSTSL